MIFRVELLAHCFDHASLKMCFYKGFRMLALGWSDAHTFIPIDFSLLSSKKAQINGISEEIDKRTCGYKRRQNALQTAPKQIPDMIKRALANGVDASYVLIDSWFTLPPLVKAIVDQGLDVKCSKSYDLFYIYCISFNFNIFMPRKILNPK